MWYFCLFAISFPVCCEEMSLILRGPVPVLPGLWISSCSAFLVELTVPSFLLPRTSLLFYHSTDTVFPLDSAFPAQLRPPWAESLYLTDFGSSSASTASSQVTPWIRLNGWLLEVFFSIFTLRRTCLWCQHRRAVGNHRSLVPPFAPSCCCCCWKVGLWSLSLISHVYPLRSKTTALTDDSIRTMSEVITGIRTVKMYAWEQSFIDLITRLRRYIFVHITPYFCTFPPIFIDWN